MEEIWKDIKGYEGLYQVSNAGRVKSLKKNVNCNGGKRTIEEKIIKTYDRGNGYIFAQLYKNGRYKNIFVHRLVAQAFIDNPNNYKEINHKDLNTQNNNYTNLEWCTRQYNNKYANRPQRAADKRTFKVIQRDLITKEVINIWKSLSEASRGTNTSIGNICQCCKGIRNKANGYIWEYGKE